MNLDQSTQAVALNKSFDETGITFHSRAEALAALRATGSEIIFADEDGKPYCSYDGEHSLSLSDALTRLAFDEREKLADCRTLPRGGAGRARPGIDNKGLYKTPAEKIAVINEKGLDYWERLPVTGLATSEVKSQSEWLKLPPAERARRWEKDPLAFERLPRTPAPNTPGKGRVFDAALTKELSTRGKR
jgi:hypothetical protein